MKNATIRGMTAFLLAMIPTPLSAQSRTSPLPESANSTIGYQSVAEALKSLRSKPGVIFTTENGWLIATEEAAYTIWSFAPQSYDAYPAVVKRQVIPEGPSQSRIEMKVQCEASKKACDDLVRTFADMNGMPLTN